MQNSRFKSDFAAILKKAGDKAELVVRKSAIAIGNGLVEKSPVDTGRFRGNWQCGIGAINGNTSSAEDRSGASVNGRIMLAVNAWKAGQTIYLTNSLPYARRLEYGWSKQAPGGMVSLTVVDFQQSVRRAAAEIK